MKAEKYYLVDRIAGYGKCNSKVVEAFGLGKAVMCKCFNDGVYEGKAFINDFLPGPNLCVNVDGNGTGIAFPLSIL
jgi:hypothetical protein